MPFLSPFLATCFIVYDAEGEIGLYDCRRDISLVLLVPRVIRVLGTYLLTYPFSDQKKKKKKGGRGGVRASCEELLIFLVRNCLQNLMPLFINKHVES